MESLQVMIAEDDALVSQGLSVMLSQAGHEVVVSASDGETAVREAIEKKPDIILMDLKLPGIDGIEATRQIVEEYPVPIVAITGFPDDEMAVQAAEAGIYAYLVKPISPSDLAPALAVALNRFKERSVIYEELNHLRDTLETRKFAEQAKGIIMQRLQLPEGQAYAHLREKCRNQQKTMKQASLEVIEAERQFLELLAKEPPSRMRTSRSYEDRIHNSQ